MDEKAHFYNDISGNHMLIIICESWSCHVIKAFKRKRRSRRVV